MNNGEFTSLNIALYPPQDIRNRAIEISRDIASRHSVYFILDDISFYSHITLYSPAFPREKC